MSGNLDCQIKSITCVDSSYTLEVFLTGIRRKQLTCRRKSLTNFITNTFVVYRVRLATRNGIHYLSPFNVYYISLTGYHILAHIVTDMCYNMFKLTSTFLVFKKMHGIATVLFKVVVFFVCLFVCFFLFLHQMMFWKTQNMFTV